MTNIVFFLSDQHNAKFLGHKGHPNVKTPNIDRMAAEGVRFENAITQNPICTPSRICFLSGQYCHNHGYYGLSGANPGELPNLFAHFRQASYTTGHFGKSHCGEYWIEDQCDVFKDTYGCSIIGRPPEYLAFLKERGKQDMEDYGPLPEFPEYRRSSHDARASWLTYEESPEGWTTTQSIAFMRAAAAQGKPFFVHVSVNRPHATACPSEPFWSMYDEKDFVLPPNAEYEMVHKAPHLLRMVERWREGKWILREPKSYEAARLRKLHGYIGAISQVDHSVGQILTFLQESGLAEDTVVIYSADHGEYACEHGIIEKAPGICSDAVTRVPYIWWAPGRFKAGHVAEEIVETVDMSTTLCSLAGIDPMETSDGRDISYLLQGESGEVHSIGVTEFAWSKSVRKERFRYVYYPGEMFAARYPDGFGELYDLEADPWEMRNLYFEPEYQGVIADVRSELLDWLVTTTRPCTVLGINGTESAAERFGMNRQRLRRYRNIVNYDGKIHPDEIRRRLESANYV
jgi:choline-sulfatase/uncharacterized sulfatase